MSIRSTGLTVALGLSVLVGACTGPVSLLQPSTLASAPPSQPSPSSASSPAANAAPLPTCFDNGKGSLRPQGPLPAPGNFPAASFMRTVFERGKLVVGVSQDTLLFGYLNPATNQLEGFDIDIAREISKAMFGDYNHIELKVTSVTQPIPALKGGSVDMVARTFTANCARWKDIDFSTVYYSSGQSLLVLKASPYRSMQDLSGKKVCAAAGSTSIANIQRQPSRPVAVGLPDQSDCLVALQRGDVDAVSTDEAVLLGLAAQDPGVTVVGGKFTDEPYALGISQAHSDFVRFVNAVLERMRADGTWAAIYNRWLSRFGASVTPPPAVYKD